MNKSKKEGQLTSSLTKLTHISDRTPAQRWREMGDIDGVWRDRIP